MTWFRVSGDFEGIRAHARTVFCQREEARIPETHGNWLAHLLRLWALVEINPAIAQHFSWEELQGVAIVKGVRSEVDSMKPCPRCKALTASLYACEKCGASLKG